MLLSLRQVSERLNVSLGTIRNIVRRGELRACRIGRSIRVRAEALEEYLERAEKIEAGQARD